MTHEEKTHRNNKDYTKGKIYIIRNSENDLTYIGSTCQTLAQRMAQHRKDMKNPKRQHMRLYKTMIELGKDAFYIELLEDYPCQRQEELLKKEGERIREYQSKLNTVISGRSKQEYHQDNKEKDAEKDKQYYQNNKDRILEHKKQYRQKHKDSIAEKDRRKYQRNKENILEKRRQYYQKNKESIDERKKLYNQMNKDKIALNKKQYYQNNKDKLTERSRERYKNNREHKLEQTKQYQEKNKDKIAERRPQLRNEKKQKEIDTEILDWKDYAKLCG